MSYCVRCGKQTENEEFVCDECRRKEGAVSGAAGQGAAEQRLQPAGEVPPAASAVLPFSRAAKLGMIFSLVAAGCLILAVSVIGFGLDAAMENIVADAKEVAPVLLILSVIAVGLVSFLPMVASWVLAALGVVFSAVAVARRKRFRGWEMAVAGLIISAAVLLLMIFAAAIG